MEELMKEVEWISPPQRWHRLLHIEGRSRKCNNKNEEQ